MQTSRLFIAMTAAAVVLASCAKENSPVNVSKEKTVSFIAESIETKTAFGAKDGNSYPTFWTSNDKRVKISLNYGTGYDATVTPSEDFKTATFTKDFTDDESGSYTFYSLSPSSAYISMSADYKDWAITIPAGQTPSATSVDEGAQILAAKSTTYNSWPSKVSFNFSHVTAYGMMSLINLDLGEEETIQAVALTAEENWVGDWYYYPTANGSHTEGEVSAKNASKTITLTTSSASNLWFACAPVDLSGKKITVTVNTTAGTYNKKITWPIEKPFTSGKIYKFNVDMTGIAPTTPKVYTKVTDKYDITVDSELIIVAADANYAMSTTQSSYIGQASITKNNNTISSPGEDVQVFKAKKGKKTNTISFYNGEKYIYASSSTSNELKAQDSIDDNASFSLEISNGKAALVAQGTNTRNTIRYNSGNTRFSCYASGQGDICIYKLDDSGTDTPIFVNIPVTGVTIDETASVAVGGTTTLTATITPADATNKKVTWSSNKTEVATVDATGKVTGVAAGTATITVTTEDGSFTDTCEVTVTAASGTTVTYKQDSASEASASSGTAPEGSSVTFINTYSSNKQQLTKSNSMTLTLKGYTGKKITGITLSMRSNSSGGAGYLSVKAGNTVLASIGSPDNGVSFKDVWYGSWSTDYVNIEVTIVDKTRVIASGEDVTITIGATANSLYCQSFTITYE